MASGRFRGQQPEAVAVAAPVAATSAVGGGAAGGRRPAAVAAMRAPRSKSTLHAPANPFSVFGSRRAGDPIAEMSAGAVLLGGGDGVASQRSSPPPPPVSLSSQSIFSGNVGRRGAAQTVGGAVGGGGRREGAAAATAGGPEEGDSDLDLLDVMSHHGELDKDWDDILAAVSLPSQHQQAGGAEGRGLGGGAASSGSAQA